MDSCDDGSPFDKLPPELICTICDHLDLEALKALSLTCHRLEQICANQCAHRFFLCIPGNRLAYYNYQLGTIAEKVEEAAILLKSTKRRYRRVHLDVQYEPEADSIEHMQAILDKQLLQQLAVLKLDLPALSGNLAVHLSNVVAKMDCLLELDICYRHQLTNVSLPLSSDLNLINRSLRKLSLDCVLSARIDCPNMQSLAVKGPFDIEAIVGKQYALHGVREPYWKLKHIKELVITKHLHSHPFPDSSTLAASYRVQFYRQLQHLKKLYYNVNGASDWILQTICESCVQLELLYFLVLEVEDQNSLRFLSNLTNLRELNILSARNVISFAGVRLPNLKTLLLDFVEIYWPPVEGFDSIEWLKIKAFPWQEKQICDLFAGPLNRLRFLWIELPVDLELSWYRNIFAALTKLPALKTLVLHNMPSLNHLNVMKPLLQLTKLTVHLSYGSDGTTDPVEVPKLVPNVERIKIYEGMELEKVRWNKNVASVPKI
uniref:F-box domain-containing protein n=1 Tax=Anopheles quadriannulatus TaxID=34691 RepID=A0A904A433_ANOQN